MIRWLKGAVAVLWTVLAGLWMLYVAQAPAPVWISLSIAFLAILATATLVAASAVATWRRGDRIRVAALVGIAALSLVVHVVGIDHEVEDMYYFDEGTYRHHADEINQGRYLRDSFFYPHLLYYIDAFVTWTASLAVEPVLAASQWLFGVADWSVFCRLLARLITAVLAGLTAVPVFLLGERLAGLYAGVMGALLIALAPVYNQGAHFNTSDVPSAFFAALSFNAAGRLLSAESRKDYILAGIYAGLAAGTKYPAGLVALAIVAVYLRWRIRDRRFSWSLAWAGLPSLAVFLLSTPGLALDPRHSILGSKGALFGVRQYSQGGWIGVVVDSNSAYYFQLIVQSFAWPALVLGLAGLLLLSGQRRSLVLWLLPFPVLYLTLISSMNMVVERNLYPALPAVAVFLGIGLATLAEGLVARGRWGRAPVAVALAAISLALPGFWVAAQDIAYARQSTRQVGARWVYENLPRGAVILRERYTPNIDPTAFKVEKTRWIGSFSVGQLTAGDVDFVALASDAYERFLRPDLHFKDYHRVAERNYREIFEQLELVKELAPDRTRMGPGIRIYKVKLPESPLPDEQTLDATRPIFKHLRQAREQLARVQLTKSHRWYTYRAALPAGAHRLEFTGEVPGYAYLSVMDLDNREVAYGARTSDGTFAITVERPGRYLLRFFLARESRLETLEIRRGPPSGGA